MTSGVDNWVWKMFGATYFFRMQFLVHWFRYLVSLGLRGARKVCLSSATEGACLDHLEPLEAHVAHVAPSGAH
jgi:hypothetical protein